MKRLTDGSVQLWVVYGRRGARGLLVEIPYPICMIDHLAGGQRETGLEPATSTLGRLHSTIELLPRGEVPMVDHAADGRTADP
jgi:hypothetical protein